jgi:hypothetical protein
MSTERTNASSILPSTTNSGALVGHRWWRYRSVRAPVHHDELWKFESVWGRALEVRISVGEMRREWLALLMGRVQMGLVGWVVY